MEDLRNILVAVDLGESSQQAFAEARDLAKRFGATLHLLCVVQDPSALAWAPAAPADTLAALGKQMRADAAAHLDRLQRALEREQVQAQTLVRLGWRPSTDILTYAAANRIDLIVVGRGNHGSPEAAAEPDSVSEALVRGAPCAVLMVPAHTPVGHARKE
jgi:nucleotide-binding universal stress UspA family protein